MSGPGQAHVNSSILRVTCGCDATLQKGRNTELLFERKFASYKNVHYRKASCVANKSRVRRICIAAFACYTDFAAILSAEKARTRRRGHVRYGNPA